MKFSDLASLWENKRTRAIVILVLYLIFFIFMASMFKTSNDAKKVIPVETKKDYLELYCERANYEYEVNYQVNDTKFVIKGEHFRKDSHFTKEDNEYYVKNEIFYILDNEYYKKTDIDFDYYNVGSICSLIKNGKLIGKSEDYENESVIYSYSSKDDVRDQNINISYNVKNDVIDKVKLDLSIDDNTYIIDIEYKNIGQVSNFTSMFKEEGVEE